MQCLSRRRKVFIKLTVGPNKASTSQLPGHRSSIYNHQHLLPGYRAYGNTEIKFWLLKIAFLPGSVALPPLSPCGFDAFWLSIGPRLFSVIARAGAASSLTQVRLRVWGANELLIRARRTRGSVPLGTSKKSRSRKKAEHTVRSFCFSPTANLGKIEECF